MKKTLSTWEAADFLFQDKNAGWTRAGAFALVEYLEELEYDLDEEIELDVVAIRCDFSEYDSLIDWALQYWGTEFLLEACESMSIPEEIAAESEGYALSDIEEQIREDIRCQGPLIEFDGGVIVSAF